MSAFAVACWMGSSASFAQLGFDPPPRPNPQQSAVRGLEDSFRATSPAAVAPEPPQARGSSVSEAASRQSPSISTAPGNATPLEGGEIIARIDGEIVLASDVLWQANQIIAANQDRIPPHELANFRRMLLRQQVMGLIDTKVLYADFRRSVPEENLPNLEENLTEPFEEMEVPRLMEMLEVNDRRALAELLRKRGTSLADVKRQFMERTIAGEWLRQMAPKPKPVTHDQMLSYYQEHLDEYDVPAQAKWEELMVRFDRMDGDRSKAWRAIAELGNEVWKQVVQNPELRGAVFTDLAKKKSHGFTAPQGGQHDWTTRGSLRSDELNEALFSLEVGQLSDIIETEHGFHIVRVLDRKEAGRVPFTEAQADIRKVLETEAKKDLVEREMEKLRKGSHIWTAFDGEITGAQLTAMMRRPGPK